MNKRDLPFFILPLLWLVTSIMILWFPLGFSFKKPTAVLFMLFGLFTLFKPQPMLNLRDKLDSWPAKYWYWIVGIGSVLAFLLLTTLKFRMHYYFQTSADLARLANVAWNTSQGYFLDSSTDGHLSLLANHFKIILALFAPFLALWPDARTLLTIESFGLALAIAPIFLLVRKNSGSFALAAVIGLALILSPYMIRITRYDAHTMSLCVPIYLWALYFWETNRRSYFLYLMLSALTLKEESPVHLVAVGIYLLLRSKDNWKWALALACVGIASFFGIAFLMAEVSGGNYWITERYSSFGAGGGLSGILVEYLTKPHIFLLRFITPLQKAETIGKFFMFCGLVPIFSGVAVVPMLIALLPHWVSGYPPQYQLGWHYSAAPLAFAFYAVSVAIGKYPKFFKNPRVIACALILIGSGMVHMGRYYRIKPAQRQSAAYELFAMIPADAKVQAPNHLMPHLACRREIFQFPECRYTPDMLYLGYPKPDYVMFDFKGNLYPTGSLSAYEVLADAIRKNPEYELLISKQGFELWKRRGQS
ncbi:DUF2079 domain-containing protein [Elusimicrobiota bacterium]